MLTFQSHFLFRSRVSRLHESHIQPGQVDVGTGDCGLQLVMMMCKIVRVGVLVAHGLRSLLVLAGSCTTFVVQSGVPVGNKVKLVGLAVRVPIVCPVYPAMK